jgi:hypothetical protein
MRRKIFNNFESLEELVYWMYNKIKNGSVGGGSGGITQTQLDNALGNKVDKVPGKGLSTNDYTTEDKNKITLVGNKLDKGTYTGTAKDLKDAIDAVNSKTIHWNDVTDKPNLDSLPSYKTITDAHKFLDKDGAIHFGSGSGIANSPGNYFYEMIGFTHSNKNWGFIIAKNIDEDDKTLYIKQVINGSYKDWFQLKSVSSVGTAISSNWTATVEHQNNTIFVENSLSIELRQLQNMGSISFRKVFAGGSVTFNCSGKQIIYTNDSSFNGGDGSTAVVSIYGNKCYIDIRNI